jgi:hypothetical protein
MNAGSLLSVENGMGTNAVSNLNVQKTIQAGNGNFSVSTNGDVNKIKGLSYSFPTNNATTNSFLINDGNGNLSWVKRSVFIPFLTPSANTAWNTQPTALTEFMGSTRNRVQSDFSSISQVRLSIDIMTAGFANANIKAQYSLDQVTWRYFDAAQSGPSVSLSATGLKASLWVDIESGAKTDVVVRIVGITGNGTNSPTFGMITLQAR